MAGFATLPPELICEIVKCSATPFALELSSTNRRLHAVCTPFVYRDIRLSEEGDLLKLSETLRSRPGLAKLVRKISIECDEELFTARLRRNKGPTFRRVKCAAAIGSLENLERLTLRPCLMMPLLPAGAFPKLRKLVTRFSPHLAPFLETHPTIQVLHIDTEDTDAGEGAEMASVVLPALREFTGPAVVAAAVIPGSRVAAPTIRWDDPATPAPAAAARIARLARAQAHLTELSSLTTAWNAPVLALARALPHLTVLRVANLAPGLQRAAHRAFRAALAGALAHLPCLVTLDVAAPTYGRVQTRAELGGEWRDLRAWRGLCPSLRRCTLLSRIAWERLPAAPDLWFPVNAGDTLDCDPSQFLQWFRGAIWRTGAETRERYEALLCEWFPEEMAELDRKLIQVSYAADGGVTVSISC
ncbi:hypothetical protein B0H15DRAFT_1026163 [Mycena belliarum]|uniref:F-box domain-containing protein n=1 Tax=Mycena belliarum TaxID=1033014 RepID=A0AAD6TSB8_9AGAR|nr:hypothetical protein B0H15DRAFT_1026163 [Mycena belliae]